MVMKRIRLELERALHEHPVFADSLHEAVCILTEEVGELAQAVNDEDHEAVLSESAQVAAVCIRLINMVDPRSEF